MKKITIQNIQDFKSSGSPFATLTAYDYNSAHILDAAEIPLILVGDSASMTMYGYDTTLPISMDEMMLVVKAVARGAMHSLVVADMPFLSYQPSKRDAVYNAGKFIKKGGAGAVKLEGGVEYLERILKIIEAGIPVMGHLGLQPQSILKESGYKIQGKSLKEALKIYNDAIALDQAGVFAIVLEGIPHELAQIITEKISVPTIGIGAGKKCDGQIQVFHDLIGSFDSKVPKHAKKYINNYTIIQDVLENYCSDVVNKKFPNKTNSVAMSPAELLKLKKKIENI